MVLPCLPGTSLVPPGLSKMILSCLLGASLVLRRLSKGSFPARCASQAVQLILSCLPGASLVPPWCLAGCPNGPFLLAWCLPGVQMRFCGLPGVRSTGSSSKGFRGTDSSSKGPRGLATRVESRFWTGAGFCLRFRTTSMANSPVRGKSQGGPHGRLPVAQAGQKRPVGAPVAQNCLSKASRRTGSSSTAPKVYLARAGHPTRKP